MRNDSKKLTTLALSVAIAMILSFVESKIPLFVAIPGIKVGLANIAVVFTLYKIGAKEAIAVSLVRVVLVSMIFGNIESMLFSLTGATLSFVVMFLMKKYTPLTEVAVSVSGGIMHNIGQIFVAFLLLETEVVFYYLPFLLISGIAAGVAVGIVSSLLVRKIKT